MKKIVTIVGARPQFIKAAAFSRAWRADPARREVLVHTGQHYDENMSDIFFRELGIPAPDISLGIGSGDHGAQTGRMLEAIEAVLQRERPDALLVYGDTNSTLAGALAAAKLHIPVAHVEAGLRSFNREMPEEINRVLTDHVSDYLFVPTVTAAANLEREGLGGRSVHHVGDVMYDIALLAAPLAEKHSDVLDRLGLRPDGYVLATVHRAENTDEPRRLDAIVTALRDLSRAWPVVLPAHPRMRKVLAGSSLDLGGVTVVDPVGYLDMLTLTRNARAVATDSGGLQKEAYFHRVPCGTLRDETEWVELVECGWNHLLPPDSALGKGLRTLARQGREGLPAWEPLYGTGHAAEACVEILSWAGTEGPVR